MPDAKKVQVEITVQNAIIPQSVYETLPNKKHMGKIASLGEVIEVYEDVADKLAQNFQASIVTKDSPPSIQKTLDANEQAERDRRQNLAQGEPADKEARAAELDGMKPAELDAILEENGLPVEGKKPQKVAAILTAEFPA